MWRYHLFKKVAFCCYQRHQAATWPETGVFYLRRSPYAKLPFFLGNQRAFGVVGLPFGKCLDVGPLFVVLRQVIYPQYLLKLSSYEELEGYKCVQVFLRSAAVFWLHCLSHLDSYSGHNWARVILKCSIESLFHFAMTSREEENTSIDSKYQ